MRNQAQNRVQLTALSAPQWTQGAPAPQISNHPITISTKIIAASQYEILNSSVIILIQVGID